MSKREKQTAQDEALCLGTGPPSPTITTERSDANASPDKRAKALSPPIMAERSSENAHSLEETFKVTKVTMSVRTQTISVQEFGAPTTQEEPPPHGEAEEVC